MNGGKGKPICRFAAIVKRNARRAKLFYPDRSAYILLRDRVKENQLCALCAFVVNKNLKVFRMRKAE
jgi:hypothetical protein